VLPNGDLIVARTGPDGGVYRIKAGTAVLEPLTGAPAHVAALYASGGVVVAAPAWDERDEPDVTTVVSVSSDGGTTWDTVPAPPA
jgi:hypothetical protein